MEFIDRTDCKFIGKLWFHLNLLRGFRELLHFLKIIKYSFYLQFIIEFTEFIKTVANAHQNSIPKALQLLFIALYCLVSQACSNIQLYLKEVPFCVCFKLYYDDSTTADYYLPCNTVSLLKWRSSNKCLAIIHLYSCCVLFVGFIRVDCVNCNDRKTNYIRTLF